MKINKDFAVIVNGERFEAFDILEIHIDGGMFKMICEHGKEAKKTIECRTRDVELVSAPQVPELSKPSCVSWEGYYMCGDRGFFVPPFGSSADDIEIVSPLGTMKQAFKEAIKEVGNTPKTIQVSCDIDGVQFAKAIKPGDAWHSRKSDNFDGAGWFDLAMNRIKEDRELREAIKEAVREVMEEDAINRIRSKKEKFEKDRKGFEEMTKKYQGR